MSLADRLGEFQKPPKIWVFDIETSPAITYAWRLKTDYISPSMLIEPSRVLCWAGKWIGESKVSFYSEHHHDRAVMIEQAWHALNDADIVVSYNGTRFDVPHLQREFLLAGYAPPSPWIDVDLLKTMRHRFAFMSNRLGYVTEALGLASKMDAGGMNTWKAVLRGDKAAWNLFRDYNKTDVQVTADLFTFLRPWLKLPHAGLWNGGMAACHACGSTTLTPDGIVRTRTNAYLRLACDCGAYNRQLTNGETRAA